MSRVAKAIPPRHMLLLMYDVITVGVIQTGDNLFSLHMQGRDDLSEFDLPAWHEHEEAPPSKKRRLRSGLAHCCHLDLHLFVSQKAVSWSIIPDLYIEHCGVAR